MTIEQRFVDDVTVIAVSGDMTMSGKTSASLADKVRSALQEDHTRILLDLGRVRYVDSTGLGELVHAVSAVRTRGGSLKVLNVPKRLTDLLVVTHLSGFFDCYDRELDAIRSFGRRGRATAVRATHAPR